MYSSNSTKKSSVDRQSDWMKRQVFVDGAVLEAAGLSGIAD